MVLVPIVEKKKKNQERREIHVWRLCNSRKKALWEKMGNTKKKKGKEQRIKKTARRQEREFAL